MSNPPPTAEKLASNAEHPLPTPWADGLRRLQEGRWYWLATVAGPRCLMSMC